MKKRPDRPVDARGPYRDGFASAPSASLAFTAFEAGALDKLLEGAHPMLEALRAQLPSVVLVSRDQALRGVTLHLSLPEGIDPVADEPDLRIDDVVATFAGRLERARFVLIVSKGRLDRMEGAMELDIWESEPSGFAFELVEGPADLAGLHLRVIRRL